MKTKRLISSVLLPLLFFGAVTTACSKESTSLDDCKSSALKMRNNLSDLRLAKSVKVLHGDNLQVCEYYTFVFDYSDEYTCFYLIDSAWTQYSKTDRKKHVNIDHKTNELTVYKRSEFIRYMNARSDNEFQHPSLFYYTLAGTKIVSIAPVDIKKATDTIIRNSPCKIYTATKDFKAIDDSQNYISTTALFVNGNTFDLDSLIIKNDYGNGNVSYMKEYLSDIPDFDYEGLEKLFDIESNQYRHFSRHDSKNISPSDDYSSNKNIEKPQILDFPLQDLKGNQTSIRKEEGWVLVDIWEFGCTGCYAGFKRLGQQVDSLGQTVLENNGVRILAINPMSDNLDFIGKVASKYHVPNLLYSGKGLTSKLEILVYPTYYLISPDKKMVKTGTHFKDEEIIETIKQHDKLK